MQDSLPLRRLALALLLVGGASQAPAEDLADVLEKATVNDARFQAAKHQYEATAEVRKQARANLLPSISYQIEKRDTDQDILEAQNAVFNNTSNSYTTDTQGLTIRQTLFDYQRFQRYSQSKLTVSRAEADMQAATQDLYMRVAEAYFLVLERMDQLATVQDEKAAMEKHYKVAERKAARGLSRKVDVDDARARYLNALSKEVELESYLMDAKYALAQLMGEMPDELQPLKESIALETPEPAIPEEWVSLAKQHNPQLRSAHFAAKEAAKEILVNKSGHYPTLDLMYTDTDRDAGGSLYDGSSKTETSETILQLNIPLYSGGGVSSRVRQARQAKYKADEELRFKEQEVERTTVDALRRISAAIAQIEALEQSVAAQQKMLQIKSRGYNAGRYHILEVLDAQQDLSSARQMLTKARYDYALNTLKLKYASGTLTEQDIKVVNGWLAGNEEYVIPVQPEALSESSREMPVSQPVTTESQAAASGNPQETDATQEQENASEAVNQEGENNQDASAGESLQSSSPEPEAKDAGASVPTDANSEVQEASSN